MKKVIAIVFALTLAFGISVSFAESENIIITEEFYSETEDFSYSPKPIITKDGTKYECSNISYEVISEPQLIEMEYVAEESELPEVKTFEIDGKNIELSLDRSSVEKVIPLIKEVVAPTMEDLKEVETFDGKEGKLVSTRENISSRTFVVEGVLTAPDNAEVIIIDGVEHNFNDITPTFSGYENYLKREFILPENVTFANAEWVSDSVTDGIRTKVARYYGNYPNGDYIGTYSVKAVGDTATYNNVGQEEAMYKVNAIITYSPIEPVVVNGDKQFTAVETAVMATGVGILALATGIVSGLFAGKKKRKEEK